MPDEIIKVCIDKFLTQAMLPDAARLAVEENSDNAPAFSFAPGFAMPPLPPPFLAILTGRKWRPGRTLRVRFLDGDPVVQQRIIPFALDWTKYANIHFEFGDDPNAEIRISFQYPGSWSYIGTDALGVPKDQPTMNFGWLTRDTPDDEYARVVRHEFGHALGAIHEHQNPAAGIPWDKEAVYAYFTGPPNNWTREQVDLNLFRKYSRDITQFTEFDPKSIMLYPIPNQFTIGDWEVPWRNMELSQKDKELIATVYPQRKKPMVELQVDGPRVDAEIGKHEEIDWFHFIVAEKGRFEIETSGWTDIVMALFGPDDQTQFIAEDDDSGWWFNARIRAELDPGEYYIRIKHYRPRGTGKYKIWVKKAVG